MSQVDNLSVRVSHPESTQTTSVGPGAKVPLSQARGERETELKAKLQFRRSGQKKLQTFRATDGEEEVHTIQSRASHSPMLTDRVVGLESRHVVGRSPKSEEDTSASTEWDLEDLANYC